MTKETQSTSPHHRDFQGTTIVEGDSIIMADPKYQLVKEGVVVKLLPKKIRVKYYSHTRDGKSIYYETDIFPDTVYKII